MLNISILLQYIFLYNSLSKQKVKKNKAIVTIVILPIITIIIV